MNSKKQSGFYRSVALTFLVFIIADILISPPCSEQFELLGIPLINVEESRAEPSDTTTGHISSLSSKGDQPQQSELPDDDCLTWCPHVLPSSAFTVVIQSKTTLTTNENVLRLPSAPPQGTFHPPRLV
ncbi:MAG TPA: hypothetical protein VGJ48_27105 [Pyrinomonadaceae bacterium]|jgi:hypothetical protein